MIRFRQYLEKIQQIATIKNGLLKIYQKNLWYRKNNITIYHKVKAEDSCIDHSDAICRWLYTDTDSIFDNTLSQNKNSNHQNIYDDSSKYHGEKSESNFERDKNKLLDSIIDSVEKTSTNPSEKGSI